MSLELNLGAVIYYTYLRLFCPSLIVPNRSIKSINDLDPRKLKQQGFNGVIFDKDNTLTIPHKTNLHPKISKKFKEFKKVFGKNVVILSNGINFSNKEELKKLKKSINVPLLKNNVKKPWGFSLVKNYFKCNPKKLIMIGDRILLDVVFGNRYNMHTIHTKPLTYKESPSNKFFRNHENNLISQHKQHF